MEIGFIGLGSMGGPMSRRLVEAGHKLTVFDTRKEAMEPLIKLGAEAARLAGRRRRSSRDGADESAFPRHRHEGGERR